MRRRFIREIVICLLLGVLMTVAVAWVVLLAPPDPLAKKHWLGHGTDMQGASIRFEADGLKIPPTVGIERQLSIGVRDGAFDLWLDGSGQPVEVLSPWIGNGLHRSGGRKGVRWSGWPALSMVALNEVDAWARVSSNVVRRGLALPEGWLPQSGTAWPVVDTPTTLPLLPHFPGFAIDTAFYAGVSWLLIFAPFALRRALRRRRGRCTECGYELAMLETCPECGASAPSKLK